VDASPEHLRPGFDGGTGVRTVFANSSDVGWLYPHFWEEPPGCCLERVEERKSEVQPKDGVEILYRRVRILSAVSANRNRHLGMDVSARGSVPPKSFNETLMNG
jgi:hypothetical protein